MHIWDRVGRISKDVFRPLCATLSSLQLIVKGMLIGFSAMEHAHVVDIQDVSWLDVKNDGVLRSIVVDAVRASIWAGVMGGSEISRVNGPKAVNGWREH